MAPAPVPPILYKYYPPERIGVIGDFAARFSRPSQFNDTFDCMYVTVKKRKALRAKHRESLGIFCLTANPNNDLMWVHYAKQHTGFILGFKADLIGDELGAKPRPVVYQESPPSLPWDSLPGSELALVKSLAWDYESEWRCTRMFGPNESRDVSFSPTLIAELTIGSKMAWHHISELLQILKALAPADPIQVFESIANTYTWRFERRPSRKVCCGTCNGDGFIDERDDALPA